MADAGRVLPLYKGNWVSGGTYEILDQVFYEGSTYAAKNNISDATTSPDIDTTNWVLSSRGFAAELLSLINATDTSGLLGTAGTAVTGQALMDEIADRVATKLLLKTDVVNQIENNTTKAASIASVYSVNQNLSNLSTKVNNLNGDLALKADKSQVHNLKGINPTSGNLINWASDDAKRLLIWKIIGNNASGFPDDSLEWCTLNLQDESGTRGVVAAFCFTSPGFKYRPYSNGAWLSEWVTVI